MMSTYNNPFCKNAGLKSAQYGGIFARYGVVVHTVSSIIYLLKVWKKINNIIGAADGLHRWFSGKEVTRITSRDVTDIGKKW